MPRLVGCRSHHGFTPYADATLGMRFVGITLMRHEASRLGAGAASVGGCKEVALQRLLQLIC